MFKIRHRYRHMSCLDIDMDVLGIRGATLEAVTLVVNFWNRHLKATQVRYQVVTVQKADIWKWEDLGSFRKD